MKVNKKLSKQDLCVNLFRKGYSFSEVKARGFNPNTVSQAQKKWVSMGSVVDLEKDSHPSGLDILPRDLFDSMRDSDKFDVIKHYLMYDLMEKSAALSSKDLKDIGFKDLSTHIVSLMRLFSE